MMYLDATDSWILCKQTMRNSSYFNYMLCQLKKSTALWVFVWTKTRQILIQFLHMHSSSTANILHTSENVKTQPKQVIFEVFP